MCFFLFFLHYLPPGWRRLRTVVVFPSFVYYVDVKQLATIIQRRPSRRVLIARASLERRKLSNYYREKGEEEEKENEKEKKRAPNKREMPSQRIPMYIYGYNYRHTQAFINPSIINLARAKRSFVYILQYYYV